MDRWANRTPCHTCINMSHINTIACSSIQMDVSVENISYIPQSISSVQSAQSFTPLHTRSVEIHFVVCPQEN